MNIDVAFPSKWVRAIDLKGRDVTVTIARCLEEEVAREGSTQPVLYFHGAEKGLVLNKTNANTIADGLGPETDSWIGAQITLYPTKTDFQGKRVDCIRVRELSDVEPPEPAPATAAPAAVAPATVPASAPPADSEIPF